MSAKPVSSADLSNTALALACIGRADLPRPVEWFAIPRSDLPALAYALGIHITPGAMAPAVRCIAETTPSSPVTLVRAKGTYRVRFVPRAGYRSLSAWNAIYDGVSAREHLRSRPALVLPASLVLPAEKRSPSAQKRCTGCLRELPRTDFYLMRKSEPNGRVRPRCKDCVAVSR